MFLWLKSQLILGLILVFYLKLESFVNLYAIHIYAYCLAYDINGLCFMLCLCNKLNEVLNLLCMRNGKRYPLRCDACRQYPKSAA